MKSSCFLLVQCTQIHIEQHFVHMLPAFPKSLKKSFQCVLARERVPAGLQHQTLGLRDAGQMEQTASIQTDKKEILLACPVGTAWDTSILWAHENWLTAGCDREGKNSQTNVVP